MDPNANLAQQRQLAAQIQHQIDTGQAVDPHDVNRLTELVLALDNWLSGQGFFPAVWQRGRPDPVGALRAIVEQSTDWANTWDRSPHPGHATIARELRALRAVAERGLGQQ